MNHGGRCDQPISRTSRPLGGQSSPFECYAIADRRDSVPVVVAQLFQPRYQRYSSAGIGSPLERNPFHDLAERDDAKIDGGRIDRAQPNPSFVAAAASLGKDIGVDEVTQNTI